MDWITAFCCHAVPDCLQPKHVAIGKSKHLQMMYMHSICSCGLMYLFGCDVLQLVAAILCHVSIDTCKARWKLFRSMWLDQMLHLITIYLIFEVIVITPIFITGLLGAMTGGWLARKVSLYESSPNPYKEWSRK